MNQRFFTAIIIFLSIFLLVVHPVPQLAQDVDISKIGVSEGDIFTYVIDKYESSDDTYQVNYNKTLNKWLEIRENGEFNITITNTTAEVGIFGYKIGVIYSNSSFSSDSTMSFVWIGCALY